MSIEKKLEKQLAILVVAIILFIGSIGYCIQKVVQRHSPTSACSTGCNLRKEQFNLPDVYKVEIEIMNDIAKELEQAAEQKDFVTKEKSIVANIKVWKDISRIKEMFTKEENSVAIQSVIEKTGLALSRLHKAQSKVQFSNGGTLLMQKIKAILDGE